MKEARRMPISQKSEWPERAELVLASVKKVTGYGAYVTLEEYKNKEGLLHRSEISTSWVRNIRNHVREGQKLVLKVLRVDPRKRQIDLSRKRVNKRERIEKIHSFKRERKAETLLRVVAEKLSIPIGEIIKNAAAPMEEVYGEVYTALEETARQGPEVLDKCGVPPDITKVLAELAHEKIKPPLVEISGILQLSTTNPDGVGLIKKALQAAQKTSVNQTGKIRIYTITPPKYRLGVEAKGYKEAESILEKASKAAITVITKAGGQGDFEREK